MLQNFEKDLKKFHDLFQGGRCQAWQLEELLAKAIRSDFSSSHKVLWKGNGHDIGYDILVDDKHDIQVKSGVVKKDILTLSGHRLGRFKGDIEKITDFLNSSTYNLLAVPYKKHEDKKGVQHIYQILYTNTDILKLDNYKDWKEIKGKKGGVSYKATNKYGVELSLSPSMSWQIWWEIPLSVIPEENKTREIIS